MKLFIDFETRSRADLKKVGGSVYANDPSTEVMCMAWAINVSFDGGVWLPHDTSCLDFLDAIRNGAEVHAFNAAFEWSIWEAIMVPRYGWPSIRPEQWRCTMVRCALAGLPLSLDQAAKALGLEGKDPKGAAVMHKYCKPRKPTKNNPKEWHDDPAELQSLYDYCIQDVRAEMAIHDATPEPPEFEKRLWTLDQIINRRGMSVDRDLATAAIKMREQYGEQLVELLRQLTDCTPSQVAKLTKWLQERGVNLAGLDKASVAAALEQPDLPIDAKKVLEIRRSLSNSSLKKYDALLARTDRDGRIRMVHQYAGAGRTGRWAGRGIQPQNIPRGILKTEQIEDAAHFVRQGLAADLEQYGSVPDVLVSLLRPTLQAEPGKKLIVCDFAAIEARVLAWLAGQKDVIQQFVEGKDVYKELAGRIYDKDAADIDKAERFVGKVAVLGLGYGMGWAKFKDTCAKFGQEISDEFAQKVVGVYRESNSAIKWFWYEMNDAVEAVIGGDTQQQKVRGLLIDRESRWLRIQLPSKRRLHYFDPSLEDGYWPSGDPKKEIGYAGLNNQNQWVRLRTYGGKLVENLTQAVARDLLANAMTKLEEFGYRVVLHVHDEVVVECEASYGSVAAVESIMCDTPAWAKGCPVAAEGFTSPRYRK